MMRRVQWSSMVTDLLICSNPGEAQQSRIGASAPVVPNARINKMRVNGGLRTLAGSGSKASG